MSCVFVILVNLFRRGMKERTDGHDHQAVNLKLTRR